MQHLQYYAICSADFYKNLQKFNYEIDNQRNKGE